MITTTFREHLGIRITLPQVGNAEKQELAPHEITISEAGEFYFGQQRVNEQGLRDALVTLFQKDPKATLVLRADQKADFGAVVRAIDIARQIGGERLIIPTRTDDARSL
jgi:biopolymer transport protein ExbD